MRRDLTSVLLVVSLIGLAAPSGMAATAYLGETTVATSRHRLTCHQPARSGFAYCSVAFNVEVRAPDPREPHAYVHCRLLYTARYADNPRIRYHKAREQANPVYLISGQGSTEFLIQVKGDPRHGPVKAALVDDIQCTAHR